MATDRELQEQADLITARKRPLAQVLVPASDRALRDEADRIAARSMTEADIARMEQEQLARIGERAERSAIHTATQRRQKAIAKYSPVRLGLKVAGAAPGAVAKVVGETVRRGHEGKGLPTAVEAVKLAYEGAIKTTSFQEYAPELWPEKGPVERTMLAFAADVGIAGLGGVAQAKAVTGGVKALAPVGRAALRTLPPIQRARAIGQLANEEAVSQQAIEMLQDWRVGPSIQRQAREIVATQGKAAEGAPIRPVKLVGDVPAARRELKAATIAEQRALGVVKRMGKEGASPAAIQQAQGVAGRVTGRRAATQTTLGQLRGALKQGGRVPVYKRGVTFPLPRPGETVGEADVRNLIAALAERRSLSGYALTPEDAANEVLGYARSIGLDTAALEKAAFTARGPGLLYKRRLVEAGVKSWDELERIERGGGYLRIVYGRYLTPDEHLVWLRENGLDEIADRLQNQAMNRARILSGKGGAPVGILAERRNLPVSAQEPLQPVNDVLARLEAQAYATARVLPRMETFKRMAGDASLVWQGEAKVHPKGWLKLTGGVMEERAARLRSLGYPEAADDLIAQANEGPFGRLTDKYVHPQLYFALNPEAMARSDTLRENLRIMVGRTEALLTRSMVRVPPPRVGAGRYGAAAFGGAKRLVTVYNPLSQGANVAGNLAQMHTFGGTPAVLTPELYAWGAFQVETKSPWAYEVLKRMGSFSGGGSLREIEQTAQLISQANEGGNATEAATRALARMPGRVWQLNEVASKLGVVRWQMMRGKSLEEAIGIAERALYNYNDVPQWIELMRSGKAGPASWLFPFPTYAYKTAGQFGNAVLFHPNRVNLYTRAKQAIESLTPGDVREIESAAMPEYMADQMPVRLPGEDVYGRGLYARTARMLPWGSLEVAQDVGMGIRSPFLYGPFIDLTRNESPFGNKVYQPGAPLAEKATEIAGYLAQEYLPATRVIGSAIKTARTQKVRGKLTETGKRMQYLPPTTAEAALRITPLDVERSLNSQLWDLNERKQNLDSWVRRKGIDKGGKMPADWEADDSDKKHFDEVWEQLKTEYRRLGQVKARYDEERVDVAGHSRWRPRRKK